MANNISIFMSFGDVKGDVTEAKHQNWVRLDSCDFGVQRSVSQETGSPKRNVGTPSISQIKISKVMDCATPGIFLETISGSGQACTLHFAKGNSGDKAQVFMEIKLENTLISNYTVSAKSDSHNTEETMILSFTSIRTIYTPYDASGKAGTPMASGYDIAAAKRI